MNKRGDIMGNFFGGLLGLGKTVIIAIAAIVGLMILTFGIIFGMCIS